ncbi:hypothetical protein L1987_48377 [Smallanthus sonchifolius]|uniref:Uncharacterized protein n=1 Tax=Smallanthus sonchifolius TaxID=185202 RepID=A0ACB9FS98_9ASTR|nr:hypothetical protein L1987_48377 [Smallanthus sonchifolius]
MDLSPLQHILATFVIILVVYYLSFFYKTNTAPPEASGALPIIGHFKVFSGSDLPHATLATMADRYEPIFMVRLGLRKVLVVSNWKIAKDIYTTHNVNILDRPNYIAAKILERNGSSFAFTPDGPCYNEEMTPQ